MSNGQFGRQSQATAVLEGPLSPALGPRDHVIRLVIAIIVVQRPRRQPTGDAMGRIWGYRRRIVPVYVECRARWWRSGLPDQRDVSFGWVRVFNVFGRQIRRRWRSGRAGQGWRAGWCVCCCDAFSFVKGGNPFPVQHWFLTSCWGGRTNTIHKERPSSQ